MKENWRSDTSAEDEAVSFIGSLKATGGTLPKLIVVDLDYTLWPFYCECRWSSDTPHLYPGSMPILIALKREAIPVAVASRTPTPDIARAFLEKLKLSNFFAAAEIYPSVAHKTGHLKAIAECTGVDPGDMLFFDDEQRNITAVSAMGATAVLVDDDGFCLKAFKDGLEEHAARKKAATPT